uniref:Granulins domain-containing protein n=1 Tax=Seriola lalandi dorsalis TaxID=1841481 RepID=A0A3B4XZP2_SERLL
MLSISICLRNRFGFFFSGNVIPCNDTVGCADETTCCKTKDGGWACCPLPEVQQKSLFKCIKL